MPEEALGVRGVAERFRAGREGERAGAAGAASFEQIGQLACRRPWRQKEGTPVSVAISGGEGARAG
jgi:hypothetical protein